MTQSDLCILITSLQIGVTYPLFLMWTCNLLGGIVLWI